MIAMPVYGFATLFILIMASYSDWMTKKVSNRMNLLIFAVVTLLVLVSHEGYRLFMVPYVFFPAKCLFDLRALGGGDCKLLLAIAPLMSLQELGMMTMIAMGIFSAFHMGRLLMKVVQNDSINFRGLTKPITLHRRRFTFFLLMGYFFMKIL